jgi:hypothetical protein
MVRDQRSKQFLVEAVGYCYEQASHERGRVPQLCIRIGRHRNRPRLRLQATQRWHCHLTRNRIVLDSAYMAQ